MNNKIIIRPVSEQDAPALLAIYSPYVQNTAITYEYDVPTLADFTNRITTITKRFPYLVAQNDAGEILGYAYAGIFHARKAYEHSCELSIYIRQDMKGKGIGTLLYAELEKKLEQQNITALYACIAATSRNPDSYLTDASIQFHSKKGFTLVGRFTRCAYKFDLWYDMVYMEKHLD